MSDQPDEVVDKALNAIGNEVPDAPDDHGTRCSTCLAVIAPPPPGYVRTCRCGLLTVTGTVEGPIRALRVRPGAGWSASPDVGAE